MHVNWKQWLFGFAWASGSDDYLLDRDQRTLFVFLGPVSWRLSLPRRV